MDFEVKVERVRITNKVYGILAFPRLQPVVNDVADRVLRAAESIAPAADTSYKAGFYLDEEMTGSPGRRRRTARAKNRDDLAWIVEFGSYGGARSYELDARGPFPGYSDDGYPQRMQRSTGRRTGNVGAHYVLTRAARMVGNNGREWYAPAKARG